MEQVMRKFSLVLLACLSTAACATRQQTEGTAAGAVGGALVGGPVGAVVGGVAGAVVTQPGGVIDSRRCYHRDRQGHRVRRC